MNHFRKSIVNKTFALKTFIILLISINSLISYGQNEFRSFTTLDESLILKTLFDATAVKINEDDQKLEVSWQPNNYEKTLFPVSSDGYCYTKLEKVINFKDNSDKTIFVFTTNSDLNSCHACAPFLSVAIFEKKENHEYYLSTFKKDFISHGVWGEVGGIDLIKLGTNFYCLELTSDFLGQGISTSSASYYELNQFNNILSLQTEENNGGAAFDENQFYMYKSRIKAIPSNLSHWDILITTEKTKGKMKPVIEVKRLKYNESLEKYTDK